MTWLSLIGLWLLGVVVGLSAGIILGSWYSARLLDRRISQIGNYIKKLIHSDINFDELYMKAITVLDRGKKAVDVAKEFIDILYGKKEKGG